MSIETGIEMGIQALGAEQGLVLPLAARAEGDRTSAGFGAWLDRALGEVNATHDDADAQSAAFLRGEDVPIHQVMMAVSEAEVSLRLTSTLVTRALAAYTEIARMAV